MADEREIVLSERNDIENINLYDYVPEALIRVYPYRAIFGRKDKSWLQANTNTIVRVSQYELETNVDTTNNGNPGAEIQTQSITDFENLSRDENGNLFFEAFVAVDAMTKETISQNASSFEKDLRKVKTLTMLVNKYIDSDDDRPDFFTIKKPFNEQDFIDGNQTVYYGSSFTKAYSTDLQALVDEGYDIDIEQDTVSEITLYDISELEKELDNSKLHFTENAGLFKKPKVTYLDTTTGNQVTKNGIRVRVENQTLLENIKGNGVVQITNNNGDIISDSKIDVDFKTVESVMPFKMTPINDTEKITMESSWFDYDRTMPYFIASQFKNADGFKIQDLRINPEGEKVKETSDVTITPTPNGVWKKEQTYVFKINKLNNGEDIFDWNIYLDSNLFTRFAGDSGRIKSEGIGQYGTHKYSGPIDFEYKWDSVKSELTVTNKTRDLDLPDTTLSDSFVSFVKEENMKLALQQEDVNLIEDILVLSLASQDSFNRAPVLTDGGDAGKIDPEYRLGHRGIKVQTIKGGNIGNIIDGWLLEHQAKYPSFRRDKARYQTTKSLINALSRYVVSQANATNGGSNELNSVTEPWFLELVFGGQQNNLLSYSNKQKIVVNDKKPNDDATTSKIVPSYLLNGVIYSDKGELEENSNIKFILRTNFYKQNYSSLTDYDSKPDLFLPKGVDVSNVKIYQTDRKIAFPSLPQSISKINESNLPGDIKGKDADFSYIFHLPIQKLADFQKMFLDSASATVSYKIGDRINVQLPRTADGVIWTLQQAENEILKTYKDIKFIIEPTPLLISEGSFEIKTDINNYYQNDIVAFWKDISGTVLWRGDGDANGDQNQSSWKQTDDGMKVLSDGGTFLDFLARRIEKIRNIKEGAVKVSGTIERYWGDVPVTKNLSFAINHTEFRESTIEFTKDLTATSEKNNFGARQIFFDKSQWTKFLANYLSGSVGFQDYHLIEADDSEIEYLEELIISSIWGNEIEISADGIPGIKFRMNNQDDESIAIQKIILY